MRLLMKKMMKIEEGDELVQANSRNKIVTRSQKIRL